MTLRGSEVLVGALRRDGTAAGTGTAEVFRFTCAQWEELEKLVAANGGPLDSFGESVSIAGRPAIVRACFDDEAWPGDADWDSGSACILPLESESRRRDCNADRAFEIAAAILALQALLVSESSVRTRSSACDANHEHSLNISDPVRMLGRLFAPRTPESPDRTHVPRREPTADEVMRVEFVVCPSGRW